MEDADFKKQIDELEILADVIYEQEPPLITINGFQVCTAGNFIGIVGKPKSGKTLLVTSLLLATLQNPSNIGGLKIDLPPGKPKVVVFDTEQARNHIQKQARIVLNDQDGASVRFFGLRRLNAKDRIAFIDKFLSENTDIGLVIIDGIRDLLSVGINDEKDATNVMGHLLNWSDVYQLGIVVCLHTNKNDYNSRGHIGSELDNKAECVLTLKRDGDKTEVSPTFSRNTPFSPFAITADDHGKPLEIEHIKRTPGKKTLHPEQLTTEQKSQLLEKLTKKNMSAAVVKNIIKDTCQDVLNQTVSMQVAGRIKDYLESEGYLANTGSKTSKQYNRTKKEVSPYGYSV